MKIEAAKNYQADKKESNNNFKTETSLFDTSKQLKTIESVPAQTTSAFAKILDETRKQDVKEKNNSLTAKSDSPERTSKTSKSDADEKISRQSEEKKGLEEKNRNHRDTEGRQKDDENQSSDNVLAALQLETKPVSKNSVPAARQILHVADLERIISTIRTESFQNEKKVTIALNNSILEGLQIKLTMTENGKLKAEFIALNEQIKKQLNLRKKELSEIMRNRSALFSEVEITTPKAPAKD